MSVLHLYQCLGCGYEWESEEDAAQCPECASERIDKLDDDELGDEEFDEFAEDEDFEEDFEDTDEDDAAFDYDSEED